MELDRQKHKATKQAQHPHQAPISEVLNHLSSCEIALREQLKASQAAAVAVLSDQEKIQTIFSQTESLRQVLDDTSAKLISVGGLVKEAQGYETT